MDFNPHVVRETMRRVRKRWWKKRQTKLKQRRAHLRTPLWRRVYVTPIELHDGTIRPLKGPLARTLAHTTDVSLRGIGIVLGLPLRARHAILTFILAGEESVSIVTKIEWTNRCSDRSYRYGGKFIAVAETPT